jgi:acetoin utilization deacetylase AcuC-like enzyme
MKSKPTPLFLTIDYTLLPERIQGLREMILQFRARLIDEGIANPEDIHYSRKATAEDLLGAHSLSYINDVLNLRNTQRTLTIGLILDRAGVEISLQNVGATLAAAELALENGIAMQMTGGTVYAFRDYGMSLSIFNDVAVALLHAMANGQIERGLVVSSDVFYPMGTASILAQHPEFVVLSIYDGENRMPDAPRGNYDVEVSRHIGDEEYLEIVENSILTVLDTHRPDLLMYLSSAKVQNDGTDSTFRISNEALKRRDEIVIRSAFERRIPIAVLTAGGRSRVFKDYIEIHLNTAKIVKEYSKKDWEREGSSPG